MRAIIVRLLRERADATPSDIVELLGEYVIWGPPDGHPTAQVSVRSGDALATFVAA